ncbi:MAG: twin-arginine translocation pathway signal protein [Rhodocyclaceae bacterium]|nr:MAG: twin-arginine translocation pathway signal protein [Rhodocyclaceae bacterium]
MKRRGFLGAIGAVGAMAGAPLLQGCAPELAPSLPPGRVLGDAPEPGHRLRGGSADAFPAPGETRRIPVLIVGGGIGGLAAGWKLARSGFDDFLLLEMAGETGGNSRGLATAAGACPLAAHYLPLPGVEAVAVRELLAELGVLQGDPRALRPTYDERYLCAVPQERLYRDGLWQEGLWPQIGVSASDRGQYARFQELMNAYRDRRAFTVPMAHSKRSPELLALDRVSMRDWLLAQKLDAAPLHWYVDYACRDDYGTASSETSAWAGIHYFACRSGEAANAEHDTVLTAPDGNAWLARGLERGITSRSPGRIVNGALAVRVEQTRRAVLVDVFFPAEGRSVRYEAGQLIWAAPLFLVPRVFVGEPRLADAARQYSHAPWLVANLVVTHLPVASAGAPLAWDNVLYGSPGLGYVVSTHQQMRLADAGAVLTYYRALAGVSPAAGREALLARSREAWLDEVFADLGRAHAELRSLTVAADVIRLGHAMARPTVGFVWGGAREAFAADSPRLRFAHADVSGFSIFEEAQYRGVLAAERTLRRLGVRFTSSLV